MHLLLAQAEAASGGLLGGIPGASIQKPELYLLIVLVVYMTWRFSRDSRESRTANAEQTTAMMQHVADSRLHVEKVVAEGAVHNREQAKDCHSANFRGQQQVAEMMGETRACIADIKESVIRMENMAADSKVINHEARAIQQQTKTLIEMTMAELRQPRVALGVQVNERTQDGT